FPHQSNFRQAVLATRPHFQSGRVARCAPVTCEFLGYRSREIKIAKGAMKIHAGPEHVRIDHKDFLARRTRNLDRLAHFSSWCFSQSAFLSRPYIRPNTWFGPSEYAATLLRERTLRA